MRIISGSDFVLYSSRLIEITYLLPFIPFFPMQTYLGETDNALISGDVQYFPNENIRIGHFLNSILTFAAIFTM